MLFFNLLFCRVIAARKAIKGFYKNSLHMLQRPHVVLYLDAPVETVMKNIKARNNPWDKVLPLFPPTMNFYQKSSNKDFSFSLPKDSPVWNNKRYLNDIYNEKKRRYLMDVQKHSHVLVYDWASKGEVSLVRNNLLQILA